MAREYGDWERDARSTTKSITQLGNELRDRWDDWKHEAPYSTFDECIRAELGITAQALADRRYKARKKESIAQGDTDTQPQPPRIEQQVTTLDERDRRRGLVRDLWLEGYTRTNIASALGIAPPTVQIDVATSGLPGGRRSLTRAPDDVPSGDLRWRDEDVDHEDTDVSTIEQPSFAACETPSATEAIEDVQIQLLLILGDRYHLSLKDRNRLIKVLETALERARHGNQESSTNNSRPSARVAG